MNNVLPSYGEPKAIRYRVWRRVKDRLTRYLMAFGGISVIIAIVLIFFYLLYVVLPLFRSAAVEQRASYPVPGGQQAETLILATEEYSEVGFRLTENGDLLFFQTGTGKVVSEQVLTLGAAEITSVASGDPEQAAFAVGLSDGTAIVMRHTYTITYPNDRRHISPKIEFPLGESPVVVDEDGAPLTQLTIQSNEEQTTLVAATDDRRLVLANYTVEESFLKDEVAIDKLTTELALASRGVTHLALNVKQRVLYAATVDGSISYYDLRKKDEPQLVDHVTAAPDGEHITTLELVSGGISLLAGDTRGRISQWFPVRGSNNKITLKRIRAFSLRQNPITDIAAEYFRKGFVAVDQTGHLGLYHTTAHRSLWLQRILDRKIVRLTISPRADSILVLDDVGKLHIYAVQNEHPEVSWGSLWGQVWYESRAKPEFIWQSSSASSDFEPKFSLTPLALGTVKAALYAMLFAMPLAIFGAIYTAYFMSPRMRGLVKPSIELMEALPTVILGFLAGLWLAPLVESNLPGIFLLFIVLPLSIIATAFLWRRLPPSLRHRIPDGWEAALLIPVVVLAGGLSWSLGQPLERLLFDGDMPRWLTERLGIDFDQRNSLVVGFAMGFAVIPTIFSISEDAIFAVPRHLTLGSLALGATRWQTLVRVVLLTASPGIFSAVMIGLGRAVGETMIVLMATGNTPIMDLNIFQGFRALSANIAVEMPESEVNSTHYRILFLAALVLFAATFLLNTIAELVRQRLRTKYADL